MKHSGVLYFWIRHCWVTLGLFILTACGVERPDETEFVILYTSDVMNYTLPFDYLKDKPSDVSLANFVTFVKNQRSDYGENCIVLDNGNKLLGTVPASYFNYINTEAEPLAFRTERMVGYDAVGLGDKDLDVPLMLHPTRWNPSLQPPILCANLIDTRTGDPIFTPYQIFERQGIRIAVLGLVSPSPSPWMPAEEWENVDFEDMIECARKWMPVIQEQNPDLVVGLCGASLNYQEHGNTIDTYKNPNGSIPTAIRVPGFDVMLLGGTSDREVFEVCNDAGQYVTCIQTGTSCTHCGQVRVEMQLQDDGRYKKHIFASIVNLKPYEPDADYCQQLAGVQDSIRQWLRTPLGELADTLYGIEGFFAPDSYRQLVHRAQLWFTGADISMASCIIGTDTILPGTIQPRTLFQIYPYSNQLELMEMQGLDVVRFLEYASSLQFETMKSSDDQLLALKRDYKGDPILNSAGKSTLLASPTDYTSAAGIRYVIDVSKPRGQRIHVLSMSDGSPFDLRRTYKVAINSYQGRDRGSYFSKGLGWDPATIELHAIPRPQVSVRHALQEYVRAMAGEPIRTNPTELWKLVPENLVKPAIARERNRPLPLR